jgi:hypothetical protein
MVVAFGLILGASLVLTLCWLTGNWPAEGASPNLPPPFLFIVACVVFFAGLCFLFGWLVCYVSWVLDAYTTARDNPGWRRCPGKCPQCGHYNSLYPWSH